MDQKSGVGTESIRIFFEFQRRITRVSQIVNTLLERGHRLLACGEPTQSGHSEKQEPAKVRSPRLG